MTNRKLNVANDFNRCNQQNCFDVSSSSRFPFRAPTHTQTQRQTNRQTVTGTTDDAAYTPHRRPAWV